MKYQYCKVQGKVVPQDEVVDERYDVSKCQIINDEMPPTKNPLNPSEIFTSKSKLRQRYKEAGAIEVGNEYERGYDPQVINDRDRSERNAKKFHEGLKRRLNE